MGIVKFSFAFLILLTAIAVNVSAQTINGNITGTVQDQQGAAVANATVTATNTETGTQRSVTSNEDGRFSINALTIGSYNVRVEATSFAPTTTENVQVNTSENTEITIKVSTGTVEAQVEVSSAGELLDTTQSQVSKVIDQQKILELPGRNSLNGLALLNPGVLPNQNGRPGSGFVVNGNRSRSNNFTIDGANNNDQSLSIPRQNLPPEALQQFQIVTNTFAAEYGRNAGSYVNQITRSGTNDFSGAVFYQNAGNRFDALSTTEERNFRANLARGQSEYVALRNARSVTVDNSYGFVLGGPIVKNNTFFFTDLDFNDFRSTIGSATRPALDPTSIQTLRNVRASSTTSAANISAIDYLLKTYPTAQAGSAGFGTLAAFTGQPALNFLTANRGATGGLPYGNDFNRFLGKINTRVTSKDQLSFRYLFDSLNDPGQPATIQGLELGARNRNDSLTVNDTYSVTSNLINEARFTYSYRRLIPIENFTQFANGAQVTIGGVPGGAFNGGNANFPQFRTDKVLEFTDNITYTTGNNTIKAGYNLLRYDLQNFFAPNSRGTITYPNFNDFLNDTNATVQLANGDFNLNAITYENSLFVQDDYRVNSDLTLNLGLRYEYVTTPEGFFSNAKSDLNNFAPRLGFAYNPKNFLNGKFVLRSGFAIAYDQVFQNILLNVSRNFPRVVNNSTTNCNGCRAYNGFGNIPDSATALFQGQTISGPGAVRAFFARNPQNVAASEVALVDERLFSPNERIKQPQSTQFTLSLQYEVARNLVAKAEYITTRGSNLVRELETNFSFNAPIGNGIRTNPGRGSILVGQGIAKSIYHAGQFTLENRLGDLNVFGLKFGSVSFNANYTYSSFISESDDVLGGQANRTIPADPRNPGLDRARSGFDQPHRFVFSGVFATPEVFRDNRFLNRALSGWQVSAVSTAASGTPFSILNAANAAGISGAAITTVFLSQRVGLNNPNGAANSYTTATVSNGVVTSLGARPDARYVIFPTNSGVFGNLGANTERGPSTFATNAALVKNIRTFGERQRLQLRFEVANAFNRRNFTVIPSNTLSPAPTANPGQLNNPNFLNYGLTNVAGRTFQFGARYFF